MNSLDDPFDDDDDEGSIQCCESPVRRYYLAMVTVPASILALMAVLFLVLLSDLALFQKLTWEQHWALFYSVLVSFFMILLIALFLSEGPKCCGRRWMRRGVGATLGDLCILLLFVFIGLCVAGIAYYWSLIDFSWDEHRDQLNIYLGVVSVLTFVSFLCIWKCCINCQTESPLLP